MAKKICALLFATVLLAAFGATALAGTLKRPIMLWVAWDEIPEGAVFADLLVLGDSFRDGSPERVRTENRIAANSELVTYREQGYRSLTFCTYTAGCYPRLTYYARLEATEEEYRQFEQLFERLGNALEHHSGRRYPYVCEAELEFGSDAASAARELSELLGYEDAGAAWCYAVFGEPDTEGVARDCAPESVMVAFADQNGKILQITDAFSSAKAFGEARTSLNLIASGGGLTEDRETSRTYQSRALLPAFLVLFVFLLAIVLIARIIRKTRSDPNAVRWLPSFVFSADKKRARRQPVRAGGRKTAAPRLLILLLFVAGMAAIGVRLGVISADFENTPFVQLCVLSWFLMILADLIAHELGHAFFGRLSGYRLIWVRFGPVGIRRENGRLRLFRQKLRGTSGATAMEPPERPAAEVDTARLYAGGLIVNAAISLVCGAAAVFARQPLVRLELFTATLLSAQMLAMNGIPDFVPGLRTDGTMLRDMKKSDEAHKALVQGLRITAPLLRGARPAQIDPALFAMPEKADMTNNAIAQLAEMNWRRALDAQDLPAARTWGERLVAGDAAVSPAAKATAALLNLYCDLVWGVYGGDPYAYLTDAQMLLLRRMPYQPILAAVLHGYALLYERDLQAAFAAKQTAETRDFVSLTPQDRETALGLIAAAERRAREWQLIL